MGKIKTIILGTKNRFSDFIQRTFSSKKQTFKYLAIVIFTILFLLQISMILINNSFYNNASDDILQYYTIMVDFISGLKDGSISWFNLNNYFGASFFSDVYYIPMDAFTGITFLLSYLMPIEVAYSVTELFKIFVGVMLFAYYLSLKGMKNRTIFWMGVIYFISGGTVSFMAFPVFLSLTVYMPLALIVIHFFFKKKRWIVPLFAAAAILYDFYLGYTIMAFSGLAFLLEYFKEPGFKFFKFVKETIIFVFLLLLGVLMAAIIAYPSIIFIIEETYRVEGSFNAWIINIGSWDIKLFQPNIYIRLLAKMFVEQKPIGFYGFENSYATEHFSLYISVIGLVYMNYIFFMRDKISRIYKVAIFASIIMMIIPLFSYVFSGTLDAPYTRWINMLPIFQVMILAHVFDKHGFEKVKMKYMSIIIGLLLAILGGLIYYYISQLKLDDYLASRDVLTADTIFLCISGVFLIILLIFGWLKKFTVVKWFFWIEFLVAIGYIYSGPLIIQNKINTFENGHQIDNFLSDNLDQEEFYRVYVDIDNLSVEDTNFNRMTGFATNTGIFHSWTDYETNAISKLLYDVTELQSKNKMNQFGYYLNHFLGYKYVLVSASSNYGFSEQNFTLVASDVNYKLYEMEDFTAFKVYESYLTYQEFDEYSWRNSDLALEKVLLMRVLIDTELDISAYADLEHEYVDNDSNSGNIAIYQSVTQSSVVTTSGISNPSERAFYKYDNDVLDIDYTIGAIYFKSTSVSLDDYEEVFMEFSDGSRKTCWVQADQQHQVKCEFTKTPSAIYIADTDQIDSAPSLRVRQEAAIDRSAYLVYDLSQITLDDGVEIIKFAFANKYELEKAFVVDEFGNSYYLIDGFYSVNSQPEKLYIYKSSKIYDYTTIFQLVLKYSYDDLDDVNDLLQNDFTENEYLSIKNGKINLQYVNNSISENDQIVVIPVVYSDDWKFTSNIEYETLSVSGGFLGIVIPNGTSTVDISMKFVPKGLDIGALLTLGGIVIYLGIFAFYDEDKKNNGDEIE